MTDNEETPEQKEKKRDTLLITSCILTLGNMILTTFIALFLLSK